MVKWGISLGSIGPSPGGGLAPQVGREQSLPQELEEGTPEMEKCDTPHPKASWHLQFAQGLVLRVEGPAPTPPVVLS